MNDGQVVTHRDILMSIIIPECLDLFKVYHSRKPGRKVRVQRQRVLHLPPLRIVEEKLPAPEPWALEWAAEERRGQR